MAHSLSARKRARQSERNRRRNASQRSHVRTAIKNVQKAIESGDKTAAEALDTAVERGNKHLVGVVLTRFVEWRHPVEVNNIGAQGAHFGLELSGAAADVETDVRAHGVEAVNHSLFVGEDKLFVEFRPNQGRRRVTDRPKDYTVVHVGGFEPTVSVRRPYAYLIEPGNDALVTGVFSTNRGGWGT